MASAWKAVRTCLMENLAIGVSTLVLLGGGVLALFPLKIVYPLLNVIEASPLGGFYLERRELGLMEIATEVIGWALVSIGSFGLVAFRRNDGSSKTKKLDVTARGVEFQYCLKCGYALCGLRSPNCPECGVPVESHAVPESIYLKTRLSKRFTVISIITFGLYNIDRVLASQNILYFPYWFFSSESTRVRTILAVMGLIAGAFFGIWAARLGRRWISGVFGSLNVFVLVILLLNRIGWM
jgi:hypothetical protein